ncbi:methyltransferase-like protein 17, mitochondrial isoform X2 [Zootermopsis nevadensis]|nr:methyltransferase-like protein 17, mitochondrial isoform X2 [Zootermopsis nevadensis]XP_021935019.1 methyltransferase-like protein 17, mitochondrial isoform X2 [Zootermopsis nevadensis]
MESQLIDHIKDHEIKPRKHPGVMKIRIAEVPVVVINAMKAVLKDKPVKAISFGGSELARYLKARHVPVEEDQIRYKGNEIQKQIEAKLGIDSSSLTDEQQEELELKYKNYVIKRLKETLYSWKPVVYNEHEALLYMVARFAPEYAVLRKIFTEIKTRDPDFNPHYMFDFGSGVGTGTWAARAVWGDVIQEHFNVDSSGDMNDLASLLLRGGNEEAEMSIKTVFYRQFLPASQTLKYDVVVSAYTLLELPSARTRLETIINLWNKTNRYLIIVEQGTNTGFKVINEARDFILQLGKGEEIHPSVTVAHVFSPCPHDLPCPRFMHDTTPCNFEVSYIPLPFEGRCDARKERFSYVVFKKGHRPASDVQWPRIVRTPLVRRKHTVCRMCVAAGKLEEVVFTASKHGKIPYWCARSSNWGDLLPMTVEGGKTEE